MFYFTVLAIGILGYVYVRRRRQRKTRMAAR
jgi:hypothetical protein